MTLTTFLARMRDTDSLSFEVTEYGDTVNVIFRTKDDEYIETVHPFDIPLALDALAAKTT